MNPPPDDPVRTYRLDAARQQAFAALAALVDDACAVLARRVVSGTPPAAQGPIDLVALRGLARQRQTAAAQRREMVEAFVLGALINHDNPAWNPLDPATSRRAHDSPVVALLAGDGQ